MTVSKDNDFEANLLASGRGVATNWLQNAIKAAHASGGPEEANTAVIVIQLAACNILATLAFNLERDGVMKGETALDHFIGRVCTEFEILKTRNAIGGVRAVQNPTIITP